MRQYFLLQFRLLNRHIRDFGLHPMAGWLMGAVLFVGLSFFIFHKTEYAVYAYLLAAFSLLAKLSEKGRNEFLRGCFPDRQYYKIRLLENVFVALPFLIFLLAKWHVMEAIGLGFAATALAFFKMGMGGSFTLPTPFGKRPFEFLMGFRKTYYLHLFAYFIAIMALCVLNFNLGIFALLLVFLICMTYYSDMESGYYVWIHAQQPQAFLRNKIKAAIVYASILSLPLAAVLSFVFYEYVHIILAVILLGYIYLTTVVLAKYAAYPQGMGLPQSLLLAFSLALPPMLLVTIPYFYKKSVKHLEFVLE